MKRGWAGRFNLIKYIKSEKHKEDVKKPRKKRTHLVTVGHRLGFMVIVGVLVTLIYKSKKHERARDASKRNIQICNKSEGHKKASRVTHLRNLSNYARSIEGKETSRQNMIRYNKSEKHRDVAAKNLIKWKNSKITKSQKLLSDELLKIGTENVLEHFVPKVRRIIDIAILPEKIAIEVDGFSHVTPLFCSKEEKQADDKLKDEQLQSLGWRVVRFSDTEVLKNLDSVTNKIKDLRIELGKSKKI